MSPGPEHVAEMIVTCASTLISGAFTAYRSYASYGTTKVSRLEEQRCFSFRVRRGLAPLRSWNPDPATLRVGNDYCIATSSSSIFREQKEREQAA